MKQQYKLPFANSEIIDHLYAQAAQDLFVLCVLDGKKSGQFIDIGANHPRDLSNSYLLETSYNWSGTLIEIDPDLADLCRTDRLSKVLCQDATTVNYSELFEDVKEVDYLSIDIDGINCLRVLEKISFNTHKPAVITFEHDSYRFGDEFKTFSRTLLLSHGYELLCKDVSDKGFFFEDWYVHPEKVDMARANKLRADSLEWNQIIYI